MKSAALQQVENSFKLFKRYVKNQFQLESGAEGSRHAHHFYHQCDNNHFVYSLAMEDYAYRTFPHYDR